MAYDPRVNDSWYTSSSDSDDDEKTPEGNDQKTTEKNENPLPTDEPPSIPSVEDLNTKLQDLNAKLQVTTEEVKKLQKSCEFWKSECQRANDRLSSIYNPSSITEKQTLKRQRETTQYGCRQCGMFPKRSNCICPKAKKERKTKKNSLY